VYTAASTTTCPLATLPFLAQTTNGALPTVDQIMDRVLVSHEWMGQVFEQFLATQASDDLKRLLNGVTAIVIGAHVRPSFYYAVTGAIYLDADNFWLTAEQRDVINEAPDFRSDFDRDLIYSGAWRYTENNASIFVNFPPTQRLSRSQSYLLAEAGWLLYHELAHASDFLPPARRGMLDNAQTPWGNVGPWYAAGNVLPSDQLAAAYPPRWKCARSRRSSSRASPRPTRRRRTRLTSSPRSSRPTAPPTSTTTRPRARTRPWCSRNS
jgi:hypothetical protein